MSRELIERLRTRKTVAQWTRGVDADYPAIWSPDRDCHEAAALLEQQAAEIERLRALDGERVAKLNALTVQSARDAEQIEALRKDAERYRWLRDTPWPREVERAVMLHANASWDAAIDAAMSTREGA